MSYCCWLRLATTHCHVKEASSALLAPSQLGFGIAGGEEAAVRAASRYIDNMMPGQVFVKIDFKNAEKRLNPGSSHQVLSGVVGIRTVDNRPYYNSVTLCCSRLKVHNKVTLSGRYIFAWHLKNCSSLENQNSFLATLTTWLLLAMPRAL